MGEFICELYDIYFNPVTMNYTEPKEGCGSKSGCNYCKDRPESPKGFDCNNCIYEPECEQPINKTGYNYNVP